MAIETLGKDLMDGTPLSDPRKLVSMDDLRTEIDKWRAARDESQADIDKVGDTLVHNRVPTNHHHPLLQRVRWSSRTGVRHPCPGRLLRYPLQFRKARSQANLPDFAGTMIAISELIEFLG